MGRVMFVFAVLCTVVFLAVLALAVWSFAGGAANPFMDAAM